MAALSGRMGMLKSMSWERSLSVALDVTSITCDSPRTSMESVRPPTLSTTGTGATRPMVTCTLSWRFGEKPESSAVTE